MTQTTMKWVDGVGNSPARSVDGLYLVQRLISPEGHFLAFFREEPMRYLSCGEPRTSIDGAKADADAHLEQLQKGVAA